MIKIPTPNPQVLDEGDSPCLSKLFIRGRWGYIPFTQDEPKIKYLLQEGMPRKGCSLATLRAPRYLISMENSRLYATWPVIMVSWWGVLVTCSRTGFRSGASSNSCRSQLWVLSGFWTLLLSDQFFCLVPHTGTSDKHYLNSQFVAMTQYYNRQDSWKERQECFLCLWVSVQVSAPRYDVLQRKNRSGFAS